MCLISTHFFAKTAKEDIEVYKTCSISPYSKTTLRLRGWFQSGHYYSKTETAKFQKSFDLNDHYAPIWYIASGLHANISEFLDSSTNTIWKIPKGTKYYLGNRGDIVAEKLVFVKGIRDLLGAEERIIWKNESL